LSLTEIAERFAISKMTAHRDLEILEQRQLLKRIHGGVAVLHREPSQLVSAVSQGNHFGCMICRRPASQNLLYSMTLANGEQRQACCPHCGLSAHLSLGDSIVMAMTADYLFGHPHPVQNSYFILGSMVAPCCTPSMLTFEREDMAHRFQQGFGGVMGRFNAALDFLRLAMQIGDGGNGCCHCGGGNEQKNEGGAIT
jgi:hypothetical protein